MISEICHNDLYDSSNNIISEVSEFNIIKNQYDYLIKMPIYTMTTDKVEELFI